MEYPISATVTPMSEPLVYDSEAKIVINNAHPYSTQDLSTRTAGELSRAWRDNATNEALIRKKRIEVENVKEYLVENYDELEEHADEIAKLLGITLEKSVEVTFQVEITATITLPIGKDFNDLSEYDFEVSLESTDSDYEVEGYDATINRMTED